MGTKVLGGVVCTSSSVWMHISLTSGLGCSMYLMTSSSLTTSITFTVFTTSTILTSSPKAAEIPLSSFITNSGEVGLSEHGAMYCTGEDTRKPPGGIEGNWVQNSTLAFGSGKYVVQLTNPSIKDMFLCSFIFPHSMQNGKH